MDPRFTDTAVHALARQRAHVLRQQAMDAAFASAWHWLRSRFVRQPQHRPQEAACHS